MFSLLRILEEHILPKRSKKSKKGKSTVAHNIQYAFLPALEAHISYLEILD